MSFLKTIFCKNQNKDIIAHYCCHSFSVKMASGQGDRVLVVGLLTSTFLLLAVSVTAGMLMDRSDESVSLTEDETLSEYAVSTRRPSAELGKSPIGMTIFVKRQMKAVQAETTQITAQ